MIKKTIREVLSDTELYDLAYSYALIIKVGQNIPGMEQEVATAEKNFVNLMKDLPERTHKRMTERCNCEDGVQYTEFVKKIGNDLSWYSSGRIVIDGQIGWGDCVYTQPWEPVNPEVKRRQETFDKQFKLDFEKTLTGVNVEERLERERLANNKSFESALNKYSMALVKYQRQMLENKKIIPLKRFTMDKKKFYEVMDIFTDTILSCKDNEDNKNILKAAIDVSSDKLNKLRLSIEQLFCHGLYVRRDYSSGGVKSYDFCIVTFKDLNEAHSALKRRALWWNDDSNRTLTNRVFCYHNHESCETLNERSIEIKASEKVNELYSFLTRDMKNLDTLTLANCLCYYDLISQLADVKDQYGNPKVWMFREFCETMGLLKPREEESEEDNGTEEHS